MDDDSRELIRQEARKELARRFFYDYCTLKYPRHYRPDRLFLREMCERIQSFSEQNDKRFLIINVPPRHYKSFTGSNFVEWRLGKDPTRKIMTGSYNEELSSTFATKVRNTIDEDPSPGVLTFRDIFPETRIKYGQAAMKKWALDGSTQANYLATSPSGTATGFGANDIVIDDIIKSDKEAYNEMVLDGHWSWLNNTMLSRTEGDDWKLYCIMTRWATNDLAGRIISAFGDLVEVITFKAVQDDGSMLCESVLSLSDYQLKTQEMNTDIIEANYNQQPIDVTGRLYGEFGTWAELPAGEHFKYNYTDTADKGDDFLCSVDFIAVNGFVYVTDVVMTDADMSVTEPLVADMLDRDGVNRAIFESNNGGTGFARNVKRLLEERRNIRCGVIDEPQRSNKEARILSSSAWVTNHIIMPTNWKARFPEFYTQLFSYQKRGKNKHDDAPDVLAAIYERIANEAIDFEPQVDDDIETLTGDLLDAEF